MTTGTASLFHLHFGLSAPTPSEICLLMHQGQQSRSLLLAGWLEFRPPMVMTPPLKSSGSTDRCRFACRRSCACSSPRRRGQPASQATRAIASRPRATQADVRVMANGGSAVTRMVRSDHSLENTHTHARADMLLPFCPQLNWPGTRTCTDRRAPISVRDRT